MPFLFGFLFTRKLKEKERLPGSLFCVCALGRSVESGVRTPGKEGVRC